MPSIESISFVCYQWNDGFREYLPEHVNVLAAAIKRNFSLPHRFICITDETEGFSGNVEVMPLPDEARALAKLRTVENNDKLPSSYRRLWTFSEAAKCLGDRVMMLDIDCVITRSLDPLFEMQDDFVGWTPSTKWGMPRVGGGTWLLRTGTRTKVWTEFSVSGARAAHRAGFRGSDQAWISCKLGSTCARWPLDAGIYQKQDMAHNWGRLPPDARIVHFNGDQKPWHKLSIPWVRKNWQSGVETSS
jgi:hypothetical protein